METNLEQQTPKLNVTNVSSAVFGKDGPALGEESKIGKLSRIVRTTRIKVNNVEKLVDKQENTIVNLETVTDLNSQKITRIKKIIQTQKSDIGKKLPGSTEDKDKAKLTTTLEETNRILVEIQKQLAYDFAMRAAEEKKEAEDEKKAASKSRFEREETALEKSEEKESLIKTATKKIVSPIGNIFKKLIAFLGILGKGIAVNAAFEFFKDEENQKRITKIFNILKENWQLLVKILATIAGFAIIGKVLGLLTTGLALLPAIALAGALAYVALKQDLPDYLKKDIEAVEKMPGGVTKENREKRALQLEQAEKNLGPLQRLQGQGVRLRERIKFLRTGEYGFRDEGLSKKFSFDAGLPFNVNLMGDQQIDKDTLQRTGPIQPREMGGPVIAGNTYLVGEKGPELVKFSENGQVINNMQTEKIYKMITSGKKGRTRIVELPPQTIEGPKPEIKLPQGPATKAPKISSSNSLDGYRSVTSEIYGIMV